MCDAITFKCFCPYRTLFSQRFSTARRCLGLWAVAPSGRNLYADCLLWFCLSNLLNTSFSNLLFNKYRLLHFSKDGLKAQKEYSPEQRSGYSWPSILRSERAKGRRKRADYKQFCWCMGMDSFFLLRLQRASLFIHLYPERCSGLYSYWGFAPSLLETSAAQCFDYALLPIRCVICMRIAYYDFVSLICWIQVSIICCRQDYALVTASLRLCPNVNSHNFLLIRPVLAHYRRCCTMPRRCYYLQSCSLHFNKYGLFHISKDGLKAQKEYSPEQRSGYSWPSILRSERAKGRRKRADSKQFCWCMGMDSFFLLRLQRASLFLHPYPRRCLGLYSCWGFAPSSRLTLVAAQYLGRCSCYGFTSQLFKCKLPNYLQVCPAFLVTSAAQYPVIYTC